MTEHTVQLADALEIQLQDQLAVHANGKLGGLGFYKGIAVAVPADPGAETDEARDLDPALRPVDSAHRLLKEAIDLRHGLEQRLAEEIEPLAHLVGDLRLVDPDLVGLPQDLDLGQDLLESVLELLVVELAAVQILADQKDPPEGLQGRASLRLGGMGGEDRQIDQVLEQTLEVFRAHTVVLEPSRHVVEGADPEPLPRRDQIHAGEIGVELLGGID